MNYFSILTKIVKLVRMNLEKEIPSEEFAKAGDPLSMLLFNIALENIVRENQLNREGYLM